MRLVLDVVLAVTLLEASVLLYSVYLHRSLAHGALRFRPGVNAVLRFVAPVVTNAVLRNWCGAHRLHHRHVDEPALDPHSPRVYGRLRVLLLTPRLLRQFRRRTTPRIDLIAGDIPATWLDRALGHVLVGSVIQAWILQIFLPVLDSVGIVAATVVGRVLIAGSVNNLHGGRGNGPSTIRNSRLVAAMAWGEGQHAHHHVAPSELAYTVLWSEDPGGAICRVLVRSGIASKESTPLVASKS